MIASSWKTESTVSVGVSIDINNMEGIFVDLFKCCSVWSVLVVVLRGCALGGAGAGVGGQS